MKIKLTIFCLLFLAFGFSVQAVQAKTITALNSAQVDTAFQQFGTGSALLGTTLTTTTSRLSIGDDADFAFGASDFTIDYWVRFTSGVTNAGHVGQANTYGVDHMIAVYMTGNLAAMNFDWSTDGTNVTNSVISFTALTIDTWYHFAFVRNGADLKFFVDGVQKGSTVNLGVNSLFDSTSPFFFGGKTGVYESVDGNMDDIRVSNFARWTANFTPPSSVACWDANTVLLIHADGADASTTFTDDTTVCAAGGGKPRRIIIE